MILSCLRHRACQKIEERLPSPFSGDGHPPVGGLCFPGLAIFTAVLQHLLPVAPVVLASILAGILPVGLAVLFAGRADLFSVRSVVGALLLQGSFSVLEMMPPRLLSFVSIQPTFG